MRIVDAVWEKRNLGVEVKEIICDYQDKSEKLCSELEKVNEAYSVVKIPMGHTDLLLEVQKLGYSVMEMSIQVEGKIDKMEIPAIYQRFIPHISICNADESILKKVLDEIREGSIFDTDRIARDPDFSKRIAGERYYNWSCDEIGRGAKTVVAYYKDEPVAFGINKIVGGTRYDAFLGGVFSKVQNRGLGFLALYANMESVRYQGGKIIETRVSSNNLPILRLHMQYGYEIKDMNYILVKHQ